jgi:hypothetical protein
MSIGHTESSGSRIKRTTVEGHAGRMQDENRELGERLTAGALGLKHNKRPKHR